MGVRDPVLWTHLPTDTAIDIIRTHRTDRSVVVYYNCADFSYLAPKAKRLEKSEQELVRLSDIVFATCSEMADRLSSDTRTAQVFPPGVDMAAFPEEPGTETGDRFDPLSLSMLPQPIIGYVGGLHRLVDYDLVATLAKARPSWSWVFLGTHQVSVEKLEGVANIHLFGEQPHEQLAGHMRFFDVCIVPYLNTREMTTVVPTKINEYLAVGKAIVSTNLPTVCDFNAKYQVLVTSIPSAPDFLRSIEMQLNVAHDPALKKRRREVAARADWEMQIEEMSRLIEAHLGPQPSGPARG